MNAAFAQQENLFPMAKRIHDNLPLFECYTHSGNLKSVAWNVERSGEAGQQAENSRNYVVLVVTSFATNIRIFLLGLL
jgi:hypothetical protein